MSRCFPFPPPGYEKKTRDEDFDLLQKEKHRDKKPKKEKRDKEKKEGKEKREKDRSDEKHREKKEKKEKHRDKKKDKDKNRDSDTSNHVLHEEEKLFGQERAYKGDTDNEKIKHREKEKSTVASEKVVEHSAVSNGMVLDKNIHLMQENRNHKRPHELGSKNPIEERKRSCLPGSMEIRKDVGILKMSIKSPVAPMFSSERSMERKVNGMTDRHALEAEARLSDSVHAQKFAGMVQNRAEGTSRSVEKNTDRGSELKIKMKGKEENDRKGDQIKNVDKGETVLHKNVHLMQENKNHKRLHELGKNPIEEGKRNNLPGSMEIRKDVGILKMSIKSPVAPMSSSERGMEGKVNGMMDRHALGAEARQSDSVLAHRSVEKNTDRGSELKIKMKGKEENDRQRDQIKNVEKEEMVQTYREKKVNGIMDRLALGAEARPSESVHSQRFAGVVQNRAVQSARPVEKNTELKIKMKDKDTVGQKLVVEQSRVKDSAKLGVNKNGTSIVQSARLEKPPNERNKIAPGPENSRKRKEFSPNGVLHEDDVGPKKMARITPASFPVTQNGRSLQPSQDSAIPAPGKDHRIMNGITTPSKASKKPTSEPVKKSPHPDTKYLSSVLSVPKIEECSAFDDDQEWLFCNKRSNPDSETSGIRSTPQVWAEALRIESADVLALPFVIPY